MTNQNQNNILLQLSMVANYALNYNCAKYHVVLLMLSLYIRAILALGLNILLGVTIFTEHLNTTTKINLVLFG